MSEAQDYAGAQAGLGVLPEWDLNDLFPGPESPEIRTALARAEKAAVEFHQTYAGKLNTLSPEALAAAIAAFEAVDESLSRLLSYAHLLYATDMGDPATGQFYQTLQERVTNISSALVFFTLEINRIGDADLAARIRTSRRLARYAPWLRDTRQNRPHQLSDEMERLLHEKHVVGRAAWNRLFDETIAGLRFRVEGRDLTCTEAQHLLSDRDQGRRQEAAQSIGVVLGQHVRTFALITNTLAKDKEIDDNWRRFATPAASRHLSNRVEEGVVSALVTAVRAAYPRLSHRYYRLKAQWMGQTYLDYWDRNAPLPEDDDRIRPWSEARDIVLDAYARFSPEMADIGRNFFIKPWIDAPVRPGKAQGAFAHPTVPSVHPYLLLNYQGRTRDVMTLAHELGHGVHQMLAGRQGHLLSDTPLTLAETASVFGEMLTFRALLDAEPDPLRRRLMTASKVEDMLNTVVRQIAFYDFECRLHSQRRQGELTADQIGALWQEVQYESLGPVVRFDENYRHYWAYIPHFVHSPFYVYAYAFGDCLVNSLYAVYEDGAQDFPKRYLAMLGAGGTLHHRDLLAPFGLDASHPSFWERGLSLIEALIDQLERESW